VRELVREDPVHGAIYTDPDILPEDLRTVFHQGWVFVGHESELPTRRDYRTTTIGTQRVIFVRGPRRPSRRPDEPVTHRGTVLCADER
jgi:phenylpropionate dioxygenase-like ring-hydroxylating dioxygenase large terminal subunit